jgi:hypothetical protein
MRLKDWVASRGEGELARLVRATLLSYTSVFKICHEQHQAAFRSATKLSVESEGKVSIPELCLSREDYDAMPAWERKAWAEFSVRLHRERAKRTRVPKRARLAA